ncbi:MAG: hypothetical protein ACK40X_05200, partial [Armatimonadota bacterium]
MGKSKPQRAQKKSQRKRKRTISSESKRPRWVNMLTGGVNLDARMAKLEELLAKLDEVRQAMRDAGLYVELYAAAEYFLDDHVASLLRNNE